MTPRTSPSESPPSWCSDPCRRISSATCRASRRSAGALLAAALLAVGLAGCHGGATPKAAAHAAPAAKAKTSAPATPAFEGTPAQCRRQALAALRRGKWQAAEPELLALWRAGKDPQALTDGVLVTASRARRNDIAGALAVLEEAEQRKLPETHQADLAAAIATNLPDPATAAKTLAQGAPRTASRAALVATLFERAREPRKAIPFWQLASRMAPDEVVYQRHLMNLYAITANTSGLEQAVRTVLRLSPRDLAARIDLVRLLLRTKRHDEALAAARPPKTAYAGAEQRLTEGEVLRRVGLYPESVKAYDAALAISPDSCRARLGRAEARILGKKTAKGRRELMSLVEHKVAGQPCLVAQAAHLLLRDPKTREKTRRRLEHLLHHGGGADPATLKAVLATWHPVAPLPGGAHRR